MVQHFTFKYGVESKVTVIVKKRKKANSFLENSQATVQTDSKINEK